MISDPGSWGSEHEGMDPKFVVRWVKRDAKRTASRWTIRFEPVAAGPPDPVEVTMSSSDLLEIDLDRSYTRLEVVSLIPRSGELPRFMLDLQEEALPELAAVSTEMVSTEIRDL